MDKSQKLSHVFEQIKSVKQILTPIVPDGNSFRIRGMVMRCVKYNIGQCKKLNEAEAQTLNLLEKNKLNPKTVYEWFLLEDVPPHIKEKLVQRKISLNNARVQFVQWKRLSGTRSSNEIMDDMKNVIRRLTWKSQEELH